MVVEVNNAFIADDAVFALRGQFTKAFKTNPILGQFSDQLQEDIGRAVLGKAFGVVELDVNEETKPDQLKGNDLEQRVVALDDFLVYREGGKAWRRTG